jgi:hypothetical protein
MFGGLSVGVSGFLSRIGGSILCGCSPVSAQTVILHMYELNGLSKDPFGRSEIK